MLLTLRRDLSMSFAGKTAGASAPQRPERFEPLHPAALKKWCQHSARKGQQPNEKSVPGKEKSNEQQSNWL